MAYKDKTSEAYYEKHRECSRRYYQKHKHQCRAYQVAYRLKNKARLLARITRYRQEHRGEIAQTQREYRQTHKGLYLEARRRYYATHREQISEYYRKHIVCFKNGKQVRILNKRLHPGIYNACEFCNKVTKKIYYHHWSDEHPEWGIYLCTQCHDFAERVDRDEHTRYLEMKRKVEGDGNLG